MLLCFWIRLLHGVDIAGLGRWQGDEVITPEIYVYHNASPHILVMWGKGCHGRYRLRCELRLLWSHGRVLPSDKLQMRSFTATKVVLFTACWSCRWTIMTDFICCCQRARTFTSVHVSERYPEGVRFGLSYAGCRHALVQSMACLTERCGDKMRRFYLVFHAVGENQRLRQQREAITWPVNWRWVDTSPWTESLYKHLWWCHCYSSLRMGRTNSYLGLLNEVKVLWAWYCSLSRIIFMISISCNDGGTICSWSYPKCCRRQILFILRGV